MGNELFSEHAERARRCQWHLRDLPWDEPIAFCGSTRRERTICKLDMLDVTEALYHFQLGARTRMGQHMISAWTGDDGLAECVEWHDIDENRHLRALRRLTGRLKVSGDPLTTRKQTSSPAKMWGIGRNGNGAALSEHSIVNLLIDEAVTGSLFGSVSRRSHVPLVRAVCGACADDDHRHGEYLVALLRTRLEGTHPARVMAIQTKAVRHVARLQGAFRPYLRAFAGATHSDTASVATELFRSISKVLGELGPAWNKYPPARLVHTADRSPWLLWLLR